MSHSAVQKCSATDADRTGQTPFPYSEVARARLHFTQPQWAGLKDLFTGISNQTAVVLWGQTEINDGHDPINVCVISRLNSQQIRTEWEIFVTCIFPLRKVLINWSNHVYKFMRFRCEGKGSKMRQHHVHWITNTTMSWWMQNTATALSLSPPHGAVWNGKGYGLSSVDSDFPT